MVREKTIIFGVNVNMESEDLKKAKSLKQISKLKIFSHLSAEDQISAEAELAKKIGITASDDTGQGEDNLH